MQNQRIIVELDIGQRLKRQMINLIKTESDSSSYSLMETSSDNQFLLIKESSLNESTNSSSQSSCNYVENYLCQIKQVNMISSESNFLIETIENILDKELQREYFKTYLEIQKQNNNRNQENNNQYNLKIVLAKFTSKLEL